MSETASAAFARSQKVNRSPPQDKDRKSKSGSCQFCTNEDNDQMVQCDNCNLWYHFACVNVTQEIENHDWICPKCTESKNTSHLKPIAKDGPVDIVPSGNSIIGSAGRRSNSSRASIQRLELEKLEEERSLKQKEREQREKEDAEYIRKKYEILQDMAMSQHASNASSHAARSRTRSWVENHKTQDHSDACPEQVGSNNALERSEATKTHIANSQFKPERTLVSAIMHSIPQQEPERSSHMHSQPQKQIMQQPQPLQHQSLPHMIASSQQPFLNHSRAQQLMPNNPQVGGEGQDQILTNRQIAARHVVSKELPTFSGDPEEWPIFISSLETSTRTCGYSLDENLARLQRSLKGRALDAVRSRLLFPSSVPQVIETLRVLFGRPELIIQTLLSKIRDEPAPRADKLESLISYGLSVQNLTDTMIASNQVAHLSNPTLLQELVDKLPPTIKLNWAMHKLNLNETSLTTFSEWISQMAMAIGEVTVPKHQNPFDKRPSKDKGYLHQHVEAENYPERVVDNNTQIKNTCKACSSPAHTIANCPQFIQMNRNEKWQIVHANILCRQCLNNHGRRRCRINRQCGIEGCERMHHPLLHAKPQSPPTENTQHPANTHRQSKSPILFRIVPITLYGERKSVDTFAFLDEGSSLTLLEQDLADQLELNGIAERLCLKWTADTVRTEEGSCRVVFDISEKGNSKRYRISNARTVHSLNLPVQSLSTEMISQAYPHLKNIPAKQYQDAVPKLLIGIDNWQLGLPLKYKEGKWDEPVATKTRLGWTVHGQYKIRHIRPATNTIMPSYHMCECTGDHDLHNLVKNFFAIESCGINSPNQQIPESDENQRAIKLLQSTTSLDKNRYETGLLWRFEKFELPDSLPMAKQRLKCLEKKLTNNKPLAQNLKKQIHEYQLKGYAHKATPEEISNCNHLKVWYLPIFSVTNPNKPDKVRIVWDAAAKVNGISLNSMLLKGPDQVTSLVSVLYRFRQRPIAICGDIKEMFHQVQIKAIDRQCQRFLWRQDNATEPETYVMDVMTFGSTCSPSSAQYVKNLNAKRHQTEYPRAAEAICQSHYVDDYLDSLNTENEAVQLARDVKLVHSRAGFHMRNWMSNSPTVLCELGETSASIEKTFILADELQSEKVLGMWWCPQSDSFSYHIASIKVIGEQKPTKREVLRTLMTIFDPLGLIASFLIFAKVLLQDIWRTAIGWDEEIHDNHFEKWRLWISLLPALETIKIPRCYLDKCTPESYESVQIHVFVDASEEAYAAAAYLRITCGELVHCQLVTAKTKVAPLRPISIPRMELQAALLGARMINTVSNGHSIEIKHRHLWTDSRTVLSWLNSDQRKYGQFVAFRVGEILETTNLSNWKWVPTKQNVADEGTKWARVPRIDSNERWFKGPSFLYKPESEWPSQPELKRDTEEELRPHLTHHEIELHTVIDTSRFSTWSRLLRAHAYVIRFINNAKAKIGISKGTTGTLSQDELIKSECELWRLAQKSEYLDEFVILQKNLKLPQHQKLRLAKSSPLYRESPYIDNYGVIRMNGRIDRALTNYSAKRPVLLPKRHRITFLIVDHFHRKFHHHNNETVVNELRQIFRIPNLRALMKNVIKLCQRCKNLRANPKPPQMAELPSARLAACIRPFTYVGIDYFGPIQVTVGRRSEKRWGVIFTCLTIRAVHIEIAYSLTTDSCILCIQNFIARRGPPMEIYSDNGTNFHGTCNELKRQQCIDSEILSTRFTTRNTKWLFNPPSSPHMGGSWERLIRSIKSSLEHMATIRNPNDEVLRGAFMEAEYSVNSRPLTYIPLDSESDEALTPNHFLLGSSRGLKEAPSRPTTEEAASLRCQWRRAQYLADLFWRRWVKEYLPTITRRTKWFEKTKPIEKGDIVLIVDAESPRNSWPKGKVLDVVTGRDGQVRQATVQTATGITTKPAVRLAVLDIIQQPQEAISSNADPTQKDESQLGPIIYKPAQEQQLLIGNEHEWIAYTNANE